MGAIWVSSADCRIDIATKIPRGRRSITLLSNKVFDHFERFLSRSLGSVEKYKSVFPFVLVYLSPIYFDTRRVNFVGRKQIKGQMMIRNVTLYCFMNLNKFSKFNAILLITNFIANCYRMNRINDCIVFSFEIISSKLF